MRLRQLQSYVTGRQKLPDLPKTHILWRGLSPNYVKGKVNEALRLLRRMHPSHNSCSPSAAPHRHAPLDAGDQARYIPEKPPQDPGRDQLAGHVQLSLQEPLRSGRSRILPRRPGEPTPRRTRLHHKTRNARRQPNGEPPVERFRLPGREPEQLFREPPSAIVGLGFGGQSWHTRQRNSSKTGPGGE